MKELFLNARTDRAYQAEKQMLSAFIVKINNIKAKELDKIHVKELKDTSFLALKFVEHIKSCAEVITAFQDADSDIKSESFI